MKGLIRIKRKLSSELLCPSTTLRLWLCLVLLGQVRLLLCIKLFVSWYKWTSLTGSYFAPTQTVQQIYTWSCCMST